jgi:hypothetical protein
MSDRVINSRKFLLRDARGRNVDVVAQLGGYFSITSQHGAAHDEILASAPDDVRADIQALIAVHLCDPTGTPMHGIANASYHLREGKIDAAVASLGSVVSPEDLYPVLGEATRMAADPQLVADYLEKPKAKAIKLMSLMERIKRQETSLTHTKERTELTESIASLLGKRKVDEKEIPAIAAGRFDEPTRARVAASLKTEFVATRCRAAWDARAAAAKAALDKPHYRVTGRPPITEDPTTFEGFIAKWGLEMEVGPPHRGDMTPDSRRWTLMIRGREGRGDPNSKNVMWVDFTRGNPAPPDLPMVLESLQSEFCSVMTYERDDWLMEFGFNADMKTLRKGEAAYARLLDEYIPAFKATTGGDESLRELLTSVGDNPPIDAEDYDSVAAKGLSPRL